MRKFSIFIVKGSTGNLYQVSISLDEGKLRATCDCKAGMNKTHCKHRTRIFGGDATDVVDGDIQSISGWLKGSDLERAMLDLNAIEAEERHLQKRRKAAQKVVDRIMNDV